MKDLIYSEFEDKYYNILDVEKIIVRDADEDLGNYMVTALLHKNEGWRSFDGNISEKWMSEGLINLANLKNEEKGVEVYKVVELGILHVNVSNIHIVNDATYEKLWKMVSPRAEKFAQDIKRAQQQIIKAQHKNSLDLNDY